METRKTILFIVGIFLLLIGVIIFGFFPAVSQLIHDDEVEYFTATLVDVNQESVTHVRRRHSYTSYINTLTFKSNDEKHPANFTVVEETMTNGKYRMGVGKTFSMYTYADRYALQREDLFATSGMKSVGAFIGVLGAGLMIFPLASARNRRYY